jgi:bacteriorhodopsin
MTSTESTIIHNDTSTALDMDTESIYNFQWFTEGLLLFIVSCIGLVGNSCAVATCSRQRVQRVFHRLLLVLATFDAVSELT